jgi:RNA polymerase sigma factor (sigma-70 family)
LHVTGGKKIKNKCLILRPPDINYHMPDVSDMELVQNYSRQDSEEAFAVLVQRHVNLVFSAALRHVGLPAHAEEITQAVFIILARKAASLRPDTVLEGWLYETTRLTSSSFLRGERRRQLREQEAYMQSTLNESRQDSMWDRMSPLLDEAMSRLEKKDRDAVILRFFKDKNLREVAAALNVTEAAAQSRVHRALEKLHRFFYKRGVSSTTAIIAGELSANSVHAAPVTLAKSVTAVAVAKGAAAGGSTLTLIKGALKNMAWTQAKTALMAGAAILLGAAAAALAVEEFRLPSPSYLRITGKGTMAFPNNLNAPWVIESADMEILTDGTSYHLFITTKAEGRAANLVSNGYNRKAEYGSDGTDLFEISDGSTVNETGDGLGGFAYPGRYPSPDERAMLPFLRATWMAYCSQDYFNAASNQDRFVLGNPGPSSPAGWITNRVTFWPASSLPQRIVGWSRNWWIPPRTDSRQPLQAVVLEQYPRGFKAWEFTATNPVIVGNRSVPRALMLETYAPMSADDADTNGEDMHPLRLITFIADSITNVPGRLAALPKVSAQDLLVTDWRFRELTADLIITSHATPQGWPTRGSKAFQAAATMAADMARKNRAWIESERTNESHILPPE